MGVSKKAQIKMGETIAILFIFFILLIIGAVFYMNIQRSSIGQDIQQAYELRAVELTQIISFLPELQCTEANVVKASCFDEHKLLALADVASTADGLFLYDREFGEVKIDILRVYPPAETIHLWNKEKPDFTSAPITHVPISIFNASSGKHSFGILEITVYN